MEGKPGSDEVAAEAGRPSFVSAALLTYGTNVVVAFLSLINVLIVSRALGPAGRGDVVFLTAIAWLVSHLATCGIQEANANIAGVEPKARRALATNSFIFAAVFGVAAIGALTVLIAVFPAVAGESDPALRWLTFASLPMLILAVYLRFLTQADYGFLVTNLAWLAVPITNVTVNAALAAFGWLSVGTAVATWIAGQAIGTAMVVWYIARRLAGFGRPDLGLARRSLGFGVRSHAGRIMLLGNYRLDQWILGAISGSRELGLYSVAVAWAEALSQLPTALAAVQRPDVVRASREGAVRQAAIVFRAAVAITAVFAVGMIVAAPFLCVTIFGESFRGAIDDLRVLVLGGLGVVALKQLGGALTGQNRPTLASAAIGVAFVSTVVFDIILIPPYGGLGAAIASTISYTAGGVAVALIFTRSLGGRTADLVPRWSEVPLLWHSLRRILRRRPVRAPADTASAESGEELIS